MMIPIVWRDLSKAYRLHSENAESGTSASHYLLRFYAVECGLKSVYLQQKKINRTDAIVDEQLRGSHDLIRWAKELKLPAQVVGGNSSFRLQRDGSTWRIDKAHQAWRYGARLKPVDENAVNQLMRNIQQWLEENI